MLDTALENMSQGLCMFDADGQISSSTSATPRCSAAPACRSPADCSSTCCGKKAAGQWQGDPGEFFARLVADARRAGTTATRVVTRIDRSIRVVDQPMQGGGWVATFEDITEWQEAQAQDLAHGAP